MMLVDLVQLHQGDVRRFCCFFLFVLPLTMNETRMFALDVFRTLFVVSDAANHRSFAVKGTPLEMCAKERRSPVTHAFTHLTVCSSRAHDLHYLP